MATTLAAGTRIPEITVHRMGAEGPEQVSTTDLLAGRTVVLVGVPGAFTPTCSSTHLPGFIVHADAIKAAGADAIVCMSVNDPFVMRAWGNSLNAEQLELIADGNADLTRALGMDIDLGARGLGVRCRRFALIAVDGVVRHAAIEEGTALDVSTAEEILRVLQATQP